MANQPLAESVALGVKRCQRVVIRSLTTGRAFGAGSGLHHRDVHPAAVVAARERRSRFHRPGRAQANRKAHGPVATAIRRALKPIGP